MGEAFRAEDPRPGINRKSEDARGLPENTHLPPWVILEQVDVKLISFRAQSQ